MNALLKTITCSIAITSIAGAAEQNTNIDSPHNNPQIINHLLNEDTSMAIAASLAEREQLEVQNNFQLDQETQLAIQMSLATHNAINTDETNLAIQMSLATLNEKNTWDDTRYQITDWAVKKQITTDSTYAYDFDAQSDGYGQEYDPQLQRLLHETAQKTHHEEKQAKELEAAITLSMKKEPAQEVTVLITVAEAIAANTTCQKIINLASFCSHFANSHKLELGREDAINSGTNKQSIDDMIDRAKREMDRKAAAFKNILIDQIQLDALIDILKLKFPDYSRNQITDILKEIGK